MPELPAQLPPAVGYPNGEGVFLSKSDWAVLVAHFQGLQDWIVAASSCLTQGQR